MGRRRISRAEGLVSLSVVQACLGVCTGCGSRILFVRGVGGLWSDLMISCGVEGSSTSLPRTPGTIRHCQKLMVKILSLTGDRTVGTIPIEILAYSVIGFQYSVNSGVAEADRI